MCFCFGVSPGSSAIGPGRPDHEWASSIRIVFKHQSSQIKIVQLFEGQKGPQVPFPACPMPSTHARPLWSAWGASCLKMHDRRNNMPKHAMPDALFMWMYYFMFVLWALHPILPVYSFCCLITLDAMGLRSAQNSTWEWGRVGMGVTVGLCHLPRGHANHCSSVY